MVSINDLAICNAKISAQRVAGVSIEIIERRANLESAANLERTRTSANANV